MFPQEITATLTTLFKQKDRSVVVFLQGPPGMGKTAVVGQAAQQASKELRTFALPTCESVDLRGLPTVVDGATSWASPLPRIGQAAQQASKELRTFALPTCESVDLRGLPTVINGATTWASPLPQNGQGVLLLDELSSAAPDVQVAAHHLVHAEPGSDMSLPSGWHLILTGNRASDKTHYRATSAPLRNRLVTINCEPDVKQWAEWAMSNHISPTVVGFLRWRPELLIAKEIPGEGAFPSPRSWGATSNILGLGMSPPIEREMIHGAIGEGATTEFAAYLRTARELPTIESILAAPTKAAVPKSPAQLYALATTLAQYTREHKKSAMRFVSRMPAEFALLYITDIRRGNYYNIREDEAIAKWIGEHSKLFEMGAAA